MKRLRKPRGYTLIEVLSAAVIIGIAVSASVSMSSTMVLQEELSWRMTVALNYQENAAKLWQLGLSPFEVDSLMPSTPGNPILGSILADTGTTTEIGEVDPDLVGNMEQANHNLTINNVGSSPLGGASPTITIVRPVNR